MQGLLELGAVAPDAVGDQLALEGVDEALGQCDFGRVFGCQEGAPAFAPGGKRLAFIRTTGDPDGTGPIRSNVTVARADGSQARAVYAKGGGMAWSPTGARLVFRGRQGNELVSVRRDGSGLRRLSKGGGPDWSTRNQIVFQREHPGFGAGVDIYAMRAGGSRVRRLTYNRRSIGPSWSPDGRRIAYDSSRPRDGIYTMAADGTGKRLIIRHGYGPAWSPDGNEDRLRSRQRPVRCALGRLARSAATPFLVAKSSGRYEESAGNPSLDG